MLKHRIATGVVVCTVVFGILFFFPAWAHLVLLLGVFAVAQLEWGDMARAAGLRYAFWTTTLCGAAFLLATAAESPVFLERRAALSWLPNPSPPWRMDVSAFLLALAPALLLALGVLRRRTERAMETFAVSFAGFWYVAVLLSFLVRLSFEWPALPGGRTNYTGRIALLLFVVLVKTADIGAYAAGRLWGRRKLIPEVSPGKTVEGLAGGYAMSVFSGLVFWAVLRWGFGDGRLGQLRFPLVHALVLPAVLTTTGVFGDLAESLVKRSVGVKDSSSRFPGMGGILDILDSLLFSAPFMYAYAVWFLHR